MVEKKIGHMKSGRTNMKKNDYPVYVVLRDWTKVRKANNPVVAEKHERRQLWDTHGQKRLTKQ